MISSFSIALSALQADATAIDVVGNNLANLNTTGYKATDAQFMQLMSQSMGVGSGGSSVGMGVAPLQTSTQYTQGNLTATNNPTDVGIHGDGFFMVKDANDQTLYTRDGSFQVGGNGYLITSTGQMVQGWNAVNGVVNPNGATSNIGIPVGALVPATATTTMSVKVNLNAAVATTDPGASFSAPIQVVDSLGTKHTLNVSFQKTGANTWSYTVTAAAADLKDPNGAKLASGALTFDGNGNLSKPDAKSDPVAVKMTGLADGANDMNIGWNLFGSSGAATLTQYAQASSVAGTSQNGLAAGQISGVGIENGGLVVATYSNGQQATIAQLALASIANPGTLVSVGNNNLQATGATAAPAIGPADTAGRGSIVAGTLESSTADMATEFTHLLNYERSYQAASRVITTADQLLQETVNLVHP